MQNLQIINTEKGIVIHGDEALLSKIEGQDLTGVDISDLRVDDQTLGELYNLAIHCRFTYVNNHFGELVTTHDNIKRYKALKEKRILETRPKRMRVVQKFSGESDLTVTFDRAMDELVFVHEGEYDDADISFVAGDFAFRLKPGEILDEALYPFTVITITATSKFKGYVRKFE
jgi:hypothetical protein